MNSIVSKDLGGLAYVAFGLSPRTGWGNYAKQLCSYLIKNCIAFPITRNREILEKSNDYKWNMMVDGINKRSQIFNNNKSILNYPFEYAFYGLGNTLEDEMIGFDIRTKSKSKKNIAIIFFERSFLDQAYIEFLEKFDLVITGSTWNRNVLLRQGLENVLFVIQGVDK